MVAAPAEAAHTSSRLSHGSSEARESGGRGCRVMPQRVKCGPRRFRSERGRGSGSLQSACMAPVPAAAGAARGSVSVTCRSRPAQSHCTTVAATFQKSRERARPPIGHLQDRILSRPFSVRYHRSRCIGEPCSPLHVTCNVTGGFSGALHLRAGVPPVRGWDLTSHACQRTWSKALRTRFRARGSLWETGR